MPLTEKMPSLGGCCICKTLCLHIIPTQAKYSFKPAKKISKINFLLLHRESMMIVLTPFNKNGSTEWISLLSEKPSAVGPCSWLSSDLHCARGWGQEKFHIKFSRVYIFALYGFRYESVLILVQNEKIGSSFGRILFVCFTNFAWQ